MATFHELFYTFIINGPLQQQQNSIKCRSFALFVENKDWKAIRRAKCLDCHVQFCKKINPNQTTPYFQELGGVTEHVMFYSRQEAPENKSI